MIDLALELSVKTGCQVTLWDLCGLQTINSIKVVRIAWMIFF